MMSKCHIIFVASLLGTVRWSTSLLTPVTQQSTSTKDVVSNRANESTNDELRIRIRKARKRDLEEVADLLSVSTADGYDTAVRPWSLSHKMKLNRLRSAFRSELCARHEAVEHFDHFGNRYGTLDSAEEIWGRDALFRSKFVRAVERSPSIYGGIKRFKLDSPPDNELMYHAMIVAEDLSNGSVIGFCEIAMLPHPKDEKHTPTFLNVITSPVVRRRGVGRALIRRTTAYVISTCRQKMTKSIALYVSDCNSAAIALYNQNGFSAVGKIMKGDQTLLYMERQLQQQP